MDARFLVWLHNHPLEDKRSILPNAELFDLVVTSAHFVCMSSVFSFYFYLLCNKIIISPVYDQIPIEEEQIELLEQIFGEENIYNFSEKNKFTESIYNFYEASDCRPHVANKIMDIIYNENEA